MEPLLNFQLRLAHYRELLDSAKTDKEKAYAYGWALVHLPGDVIGHPGWVKDLSNNQYWDYDKSPFEEPNSLHIAAEKLGDWYTLNMFGYDEVVFEDGT
ncbi:MAG: hypothetical protein HZC51_01185 [Nitrospirae bacterium]|nr:hypothetical protein [Nitrospirota bacterium]